MRFWKNVYAFNPENYKKYRDSVISDMKLLSEEQKAEAIMHSEKAVVNIWSDFEYDGLILRLAYLRKYALSYKAFSKTGKTNLNYYNNSGRDRHDYRYVYKAMAGVPVAERLVAFKEEKIKRIFETTMVVLNGRRRLSYHVGISLGNENKIEYSKKRRYLSFWGTIDSFDYPSIVHWDNITTQRGSGFFPIKVYGWLRKSEHVSMLRCEGYKMVTGELRYEAGYMLFNVHTNKLLKVCKSLTNADKHFVRFETEVADEWQWELSRNLKKQLEEEIKNKESELPEEMSEEDAWALAECF